MTNKQPQYSSLVGYNRTVWKLQKLTLTHFWQKFREINVFTIEIPKMLN